MSTIGIIQIREAINRAKGNYCGICFRSTAETKLVKPYQLNYLISKLVVRFKGRIQVCYVCEAQARSAMRFVKTVELAARVGHFFNNLGPVNWENVMNSVKEPHKYPVSESDAQTTRVALDLDAALKGTPRFQLRRTDTLVVPSPPQRKMTVVMQHEEPPIPRMHTLTPVVMTPMASMAPALLTPITPTLTPMAPTLTPVTPTMTPVPPKKGGFLSTTTKVSVDEEMQQVRVYDNETKQIVLHPMVQGIDGNVYVPSLQVQILDNGILRSAPNVQNFILDPNKDALTDPLQVVSSNQTAANQNEARMKNRQKSDYYKFLVSQIEEKNKDSNVEIIKMNDLNIVLNVDGENKNKRKRREGSDEETLSQVELLLSENAQGGCEIKYEIIDDEDDAKGASRPVLKTDRTVDWEDKIPMDVISFMDATDPNPEERIMQPPPMGVISDVRSVPDESIECIDLC
ncbi:uncharacterized protein LOC125239251 [Leguminivora glycinivorella]|uniref:uncharacterized protein LOC125239251 n=1 Tax=Leguminivora glycinivorella TaxID=1035111 RepID=UPI00200EBC66|nr:uncharacterized protein LOC125239251 [Leguminivora glycinivorella]